MANDIPHKVYTGQSQHSRLKKDFMDIDHHLQGIQVFGASNVMTVGVDPKVSRTSPGRVVPRPFIGSRTNYSAYPHSSGMAL